MKLNDRQDVNLAYMLQFENIAWYQDGVVKILDRRIYPIKTDFVYCKTYKEVAVAIKNMVTQSEGPYLAAAMGMVLAAYQSKGLYSEKKKKLLKDAAFELSHARPTTSAQMQGIVNAALKIAESDIDNSVSEEQLIEDLFLYAYNYVNDNYKRYSIIGRYLADKIPQKGKILTQCFAGTVVGTMLRECKKMNKDIQLFCAETRPYYQGSRLTASVACDMGFDVTVITDNMPAFTIQKKKIDLFTSASDVITMDGHVVNKVGTFQIAIACKYLDVPFYVTGTPDVHHKDINSVSIEERNPLLVLESFGQKITMDGVNGYYPAFDITSPDLVAGIVTDKGIYSPDKVYQYFEGE